MFTCYNVGMKNIAENTQHLLDMIANQQALLAEKEETIEQQKQSIVRLQHQLHQALNARFGRKSEKHDPDQLELTFDETNIPVNQAEIRKVDEAIHVPVHTPKAGRKPLPKELPRGEGIHDLADDDKICACGCVLQAIGDDRSEQLEYIPAKVQVIVNVRK